MKKGLREILEEQISVEPLMTVAFTVDTTTMHVSTILDLVWPNPDKTLNIVRVYETIANLILIYILRVLLRGRQHESNAPKHVSIYAMRPTLLL